MLVHRYAHSSDELAKENEPAAEHTTFVRVTTFGSKMYGRCDYEDSESAPSDEEERTADDELWFNPEPVKKEYNDKIGLPRNIIEKIMLLGSLNVYVSSSQEGMLKIWSADNLKPLRTITNGSGAWITDMVVMAQQPMAVFALDRRYNTYFWLCWFTNCWLVLILHENDSL